MKTRMPKINKFLALILALVLFTSSSVGVYAEGDDVIAAMENASVEKTDMTSTEPAEESLAGESEDSDLEGKTDGEASDEKEESNDEDGAFEDEGENQEPNDSDEDYDSDKKSPEEETKGSISEDNVEKDTELEEKHSDEHELVYEKLGDDKHKVICSQCDEYESTEECDFDKNGKCKKCGFYNEAKDASKKSVQEQMTLSAECDDVKFTVDIPEGTFETDKISLIVSAVSEDVVKEIKENNETPSNSIYNIEIQSFKISFKSGDSVVTPKNKVKITVSGLKNEPKTIVYHKGTSIFELDSENDWGVNDDGSVWISTSDYFTLSFAAFEEMLPDVPVEGVLYGGNSEKPNSPYGFGGTAEPHLDKLYQLKEIKQGYYAVRILSHNSADDSYPVIAPYNLQQNLYYVYEPVESDSFYIHLNLKAPENYTIESVYLKGGATITANEDGIYEVPLQKITDEKKANEIVVNLKQDCFSWSDSNESKYIDGATFVNYRDLETVDSKHYIRGIFGDNFHFNHGDEKKPASNYCNYRQVYQGLAADSYDAGNNGFKLANGTDSLFKNNSEYVKDYRTNVGVEFKKDADGYWTIDSESSRYELVKADSKELLKQVSGSKSFRPFGTDNHFGMILPIEFTIDGEGKNTDGKDTIFKFAGDDDVFVYIDGKLVLDLGGIHDSIRGQINFNTGDILIQGDNQNILTSSVDGSCFKNEGIGAKNLYSIVGSKKSFVRQSHELTVVYFERGANLSDCRISYNFNAINFVKDSGYLNIVKTLKEYQQEYGTVSPEFEIQYNDADGNLHSSVYSYDFTETGTKNSIMVELPADTEVTVFERFPGDNCIFESVTSTDGTVRDSNKSITGKEAVITILEGETAKVEFVNSCKAYKKDDTETDQNKRVSGDTDNHPNNEKPESDSDTSGGNEQSEVYSTRTVEIKYLSKLDSNSAKDNETITIEDGEIPLAGDGLETDSVVINANSPVTGDSILLLVICAIALLSGIALIVFYIKLMGDKKKETT